MSATGHLRLLLWAVDQYRRSRDRGQLLAGFMRVDGVPQSSRYRGSLMTALVAPPLCRYSRVSRIDTSKKKGESAMTVETARNFFFWCSIINYGILLLWALPYVFWRDGLFRWWCWWFPVSREQFNMLNIGGITIYKTGVILFNIVPCIALYLV